MFDPTADGKGNQRSFLVLHLIFASSSRMCIGLAEVIRAAEEQHMLTIAKAVKLYATDEEKGVCIWRNLVYIAAEEYECSDISIGGDGGGQRFARCADAFH